MFFNSAIRLSLSKLSFVFIFSLNKLNLTNIVVLKVKKSLDGVRLSSPTTFCMKFLFP